MRPSKIKRSEKPTKKRKFEDGTVVNCTIGIFFTNRRLTINDAQWSGDEWTYSFEEVPTRLRENLLKKAK